MKRLPWIRSLMFILGLTLLPRLVIAAEIENPLGGIETVTDVLIVLTRFVLGITALIAVIMVIYGGFVLMLSRGNSQEVQKGKDVIFWAILGMAAAILSYSIMSFFFDVITGQAA